MFGYRFRTFGTGANRLTEGWKASIMSEIGVGDRMAERCEWVCDCNRRAVRRCAVGQEQWARLSKNEI